MISLLAGNVGYRAVGAGLAFGTQLVLTKVLPPADVGVVFLCMSIAAVLSMVVTVGYPMLALTQLPRFFALEVKQLTSAFHGAYLRDTLAATTLVLLVAAGLWFLAPLPETSRTAMVFGVAAALFYGPMRYNGSVANSLRYFRWTPIPELILRPLVWLSYIGLAWLTGHGPSVYAVLWSFVASNALVTIYQTWALGHESVVLSDWAGARTRLTPILRQRALALAVVAAVVTMFADIVTLLGGFLVDHEILAVIGLTIRLAAIAGFVTQSAQIIVLPDLTDAMVKKDYAAVDSYLKRLNLLTLALMASGFIGVVIFGGWFLSLFGQTYIVGRWLLCLFFLGQTIRALSGMNQSLLSIGGGQARSAAASIYGIAMFAGVWILLQPYAGLLAPGIAIIAAELTWALALGAQAQHLLGRRGDLIWLLFKR